MIFEVALGIVGIIVAVGMPLIIFQLNGIRDDTRALQIEVHAHILRTERRMTMLEAKVFGFPEP